MLSALSWSLNFELSSNRPYDCCSFAHQLNGLPYNYGIFETNLWSPYPDVRDAAGETIGMFRDENWESLAHMAIYLDSGIYMSKFGNIGPIIMATKEEMAKGFDAGYIVGLAPKL